MVQTRFSDPFVPAPGAILDMLPGLVALFDRDLVYRYANEAYRRWRGLSPDEIVGQHCRAIVGAANFPNVEVKLRAALAGDAVTYEYDLFDGGHHRRVQGSYVPHRDGDGAVAGVLVLVTDISERHDLQRRIADSEQMFEQSFHNAPVGMAVVDPSGVILRANPGFAAMLQRPIDAIEGIRFAAITHPDDRDADLALFAEMQSGVRNQYRLDKRYLRPDGSVVETRLTVIAVRDPEGVPVRFLSHIEDVTESRAAERVVQRTAARLGLAMDAMPGGFWLMDVGTGSFETSEQLGRFVTGQPQALSLADYAGAILPEDLAVTDLTPMIEGRVDRSTAEYRVATADGVRWMRCDRRLVRDAEGRPEQLLGVAVDITDERERRARSEAEADTDALTGLLNRRGLDRRLGAAKTGSLGVLAIDLDRFKQVNDRHGHAAGDAVLAEVAERLRQEVRADDLVARIGGDEFLVVMPAASGVAVNRAAERIAAALNHHFKFEGAVLPVGGSVGGSWADALPDDLADLVTRADEALYRVKQHGRGSWRVAA